MRARSGSGGEEVSLYLLQGRDAPGPAQFGLIGPDQDV